MAAEMLARLSCHQGLLSEAASRNRMMLVVVVIDSTLSTTRCARFPAARASEIAPSEANIGSLGSGYDSRLVLFRT